MRQATITLAAEKTERKNILAQVFNDQIKGFENYRYGMMSFYIILQSCIGSIACMYLLQINASMMLLLPGAMATMMANAVLISQSPGKWSMLSVNISLIMNIAIIVALVL